MIFFIEKNCDIQKNKIFFDSQIFDNGYVFIEKIHNNNIIINNSNFNNNLLLEGFVIKINESDINTIISEF